MTAKVLGTVRQTNTYADGTPALEIHVPRNRAEGLPFHVGARVQITLRIAGIEYAAGLRATDPNDYVWVSPDLRSVNGTQTKLGRVLTGAGIRPNDHVILVAEGHVVSVETQQTVDVRHPLSSEQPPRGAPDAAIRRIRSRPNTNQITIGRAITGMRARDPLFNFDWSTLYERYDQKCLSFRPDSEHLEGVNPRPASDRALYRHLLAVFQTSTSGTGAVNIQDYEAMLYWKLYSQPAPVSNVKSEFAGAGRFQIRDGLDHLVARLPRSLPRDVPAVLDVLAEIDSVHVWGMKTPTALPVRTTFLHFFYPSVVPIFDKMVLQAVGLWSLGANSRRSVLMEYLPVAWHLANSYEPRLGGFVETPLRLIDMALWVVRDSRGAV